eukprot:XP_001701784.1 predicted protein [Chlamydomonas reinhardtii]
MRRSRSSRGGGGGLFGRRSRTSRSGRPSLAGQSSGAVMIGSPRGAGGGYGGGDLSGGGAGPAGQPPPYGYERDQSLAFRASGMADPYDLQTPTLRVPAPGVPPGGRPPLAPLLGPSGPSGSQLDAMRPPELQLETSTSRRPLPFVPRVSLTGGTSSLPSPSMAQSPTFVVDRTSLPAVPQPPPARTGSPPRVPGSMRRQGSPGEHTVDIVLDEPLSAPRSRAAARRAEMQAAGDGSRQHRSRSARRHDEGEPKVRMSFAAARRARKMSVGGAASGSEAGVDAASEAGMAKSGSARQRGSLFAWLFSGRKSKAAGSVASSPERSMAPAAAAPGTPAYAPPGGASSVPGTPPGPLLGPGPMISPVQGSATGFGGGSMPSYPSTPGSVTRSTSAVVMAAASVAAAAAAIAAAPDVYALAGPRPDGGMVVPSRDPSRRSSGLHRLRPAPLMIPSDPRLGVITAERAAAEAAAAAAAAAAGAKPAEGEGAKKGSWGKLGKMFGAIKRFASPSKGGAAEAQPAAAPGAGAAAGPAVPGTNPLNISTSLLPRPAFPNMQAAGADARTTSQTSVGPDAALSRYRSPDAAAATAATASAVQGLERKDAGGEATADGSVLKERPSKGGKGTGMRRGGGSRGDLAGLGVPDGMVDMHSPFMKAARILQGLGADLEAQDAAKTGKGGLGRHARSKSAGQGGGRAASWSPPKLRAPAFVPRGRSISPLGRGMVADVAAGSPSPGRGPPVVYLAPLAAQVQGRVVISPLKPSHDQMLLGSLALGATGGTSRRPGTAATVGGGFGGSGGGGGTIAATGRSGRLLSGAQAAFLNAQTQILQQSQLLAATHARAQAQAPWDGALNGGGAGSFTGGLRGSQEVPVGVLRSPRLLGLQEPGVGGMLLQAPDGFRAVVGAEAADWLAAAETGVLPLSRSGAGPGGRTAWVEAAGEEVLLTTAALRPPPRLPRPGLLHLGLASGGPGEPGFGTGSWRGGFGTDGVMSSAAVPGPVRSESPARMPPSAFRPHRPLGTQPPEEAAYTALRRPDQPALLAPDYPYATAEYGASLLPLPPMPGNGMRTGGVLQPRAGTQPFAGAGGGGAATASWRRGTAAAGGGLPPGLAGMGGGRGEDDDSSIASSETANSLRDMPPALALELRRREILDPSGMGLGLPTSGVSGVTVRPLRREVTTGPHVKLMKPKQLLRQLEPPGPEPTFTRRQQWTLTERHGQDRSSPQPRPEAARAQSPAPGLAPPEAAGWAPDGAAPFIRVDTAATMVRPLAPPPMPAGGRSPPRLLRVPQPPAAYQQTRRHVNFALGGGVGASEEPRFNNVRLMRVVNPPAREAEARPGERAPEQLPSRKLRVLDRPEAEIPGVVPAGTAGRTEHLLGMLRRPEQRRPATGIGHRVGLFEQPPGFGTPGGSPHGGVASASPTPPGHSPRDAATQSGPASPAIEIRVNSSTSPARPAASPRQQASYGDGGYPPYLPYPPPPSAPPPPQIVVAPTDPAALAGLAALQQLSALSALSGLGQAVGVPPVDDPTLWPDLTETTPESLQETVAQTVAAGRLRQQRALSQPNISVAQLRDMDPALVLEPPQMLGPGPLGDAQHMLRTTGVASGPTVVNLPAGPGAGFGAGAGYGGGFGTGGPAGAAGAGGRRSAAAYAPAGASREVVVYGGYQTQHLKSDLEPEPSAASLRERERRRRRGLPVEEEEDEEGGLGRAEEEKGVLPRRGGRSGGVSGGRKGRSNWKDKSGKKHHRRRKGRDAADSASNSESGSSTDHSSTSSRSDSETASSSSSSSSDGRRHSRRRRRKEKEKKKKHKKGKKAVAPDADDSHHEKGGMAPGAAADAAGKHSSAVEAAAGKAAGAKGAGLPPLGPGRTCSSASLPPIGAGGAAPASGSAAAAAGESEAAAARPEPGDDFGMGLAEKLLRQMEEPLKRVGSKAGSKAGSRAGSVKADGMEGREAQGAAGEEGAQADSDELLSPPAGRLARVFAPTSPGAVDQRESNSPNAKMVDVLHGADTERRTQEGYLPQILDQHAALRAKFIVAADNLRSAVTAAGLPQSQLALGAGNSQPAGSQQQDLPAEPTLTVVAPGEQQQQQQQADAGAAGTGSAAGAVARQDSWQFARGPGSAAGGSAKGSDGGTSASGSVAPSSHATGLEGGAGAGPGPSGPPGSQSINIYCTQLVLNPGSGPVTVPGLPAYYPAPGPAAWGGVPVAQPVMPPPGMPADWEPTADRAGLYSGASQASLAARSQGGAGFALRPEASGVSQSSRQPPIARVISRGSSIARAWGAASLGGPEPSIGSMQRLTEERLAGLAEEPTAVGSERGELEVVEEAAAGESGRVPSAEASSHAASDRAGSGSGEAALAATAAGRQQGDERGSGSGSQGSGAAATATSTAAAATATGGMLQPQDTKTQLAVELTQLIMEAFQQSGGVITAHREPGGSGDGADGAAAAGNRVGGGKVDKAVGTSAAGGSSRTGRGPGSAASGRSGSLGGFEATLSAPPSAEPVPPPQPPPMRLPATLPNAGVPRGAGPNFLQVRDIALAADAPPGPTQFTPDPATDKLTADILGGLNNWKETVMSALMGRPPPPPQPPAQLQPPAPVLQPGAGGGGAGLAAAHTVTLYDMPVVMQGQYHSPGPGQGPAAAGRPPAYLTGGQQPDPGRDLTAAEALVLEPGYAMQHSMAAIATRKQQRAAAVEERRARYAAGMDAFAADGHQPQPLHMPPPQHPWPPPGGQDYRPAPGPGTVGYGAAGVTNPATLHGWAAAGAPTFAGGASGIQRRYGGGGGTSGAVAGGRGSPLALDEDTHGTMFPQSQYAGGLAGPGVARQPHPRSPLQRVMHGEADPRKKRRAWEVPTVEQQRAAPLWEHQATFRTNVRTAMRSAGRRERTARPSPGREHGSGHEGSYHYTGSLPGRASVGVGPPTVSFADGTRGGYSPQEGDARVPYMARASHPANASPATAAVRSLATMVARRFDDGQWETRQLQKLGEGRGRGGGGGEEGGWEEDAEGVWPGDADVLGDSNVCGGCDFPGCPVHGDPGAAAAAEEERQSRRRPPGAQPGGPDAQAYTEQELTKRAHRDMARSVMLDQWMAEMKQLSAATAKAEATRKVAIASAQQAVANRRERQAAELAGIFDMLTEVDALANNISDQAGETRKMMQVLEEEAELRRVSRLNSLLHEARRLGSAVDTALGPEDKAAAGTGGEVDGGAAAASSGG